MHHDFVSLRLFVTVAECGNLTRAAERENLAVSAVSKSMAELEGQTRTPLLVRFPRGVGLTPAGQTLLQHARQVLTTLDQLDADLVEFADGVKGHVRIFSVASALNQFLPAEIEAFLAHYPGVRITLEERTGKAVAQAIAAGQCDLGIVTKQAPLEGLVTAPYHSDRLVIGVPIGHPLARRKSIRFAEALDYVFVGPHADSSLAALMKQGAVACGKNLEQRVQTSSFDTMCRLVQSRLGITLLPKGALEPHVESGRMTMVTLQEAWAQRELAVISREPAQLTHVARTVVEHLQRSAESR